MLLKAVGLFAIVPAIIFAFPFSENVQNAEELENEFQGDMIITEEELNAFNGRIDPKLRWPNNIVPYYIDPTFFSELINLSKKISFLTVKKLQMRNKLHIFTRELQQSMTLDVFN